MRGRKPGSGGDVTLVRRRAIWELEPPGSPGKAWTQTLLWQFSGPDGEDPELPPVLLPHNVLEGTTVSGGANSAGTLWHLAW